MDTAARAEEYLGYLGDRMDQESAQALQLIARLREDLERAETGIKAARVAAPTSVAVGYHFGEAGARLDQVLTRAWTLAGVAHQARGALGLTKE